MGIRLTADDLRSIVVGATILGAGGGGPRSLGETFATDIAERMDRHGTGVLLVEPGELDPQARCAVPAGAGSPTAAAGGFPLGAVTMAFEQLACTTGGAFDAVLPGEVGAGNSLIPLSVALDLTISSGRDIPVIDASGAARAMPALQMSTLAAAGLPLSPVVLANTATSVEFTTEPAAVADATMRAVIGGGAFAEDAGVALWPMCVEDVAGACISGTLSLALRLGAAVRSAVAASSDPVGAAVAEIPGAQVLLTAAVTEVALSTGGGFDRSVVTFDGAAGRAVVVGQNENLLTWVDDDPAPAVTAPDLLCYLGTDGQPFSNADLGPVQQAHTEIALIAAPTPPLGRSPAVVAAYVNLYRKLGYGGGYSQFVGR